MNVPPASPPFEPTRWTLVLRAQGGTPEARAALSELCESYYQPVFRFLRREGRDEETARELTQEFFSRVLQRADLDADPARGRFRSYLLGAVKHFLADRRDHARRQKRGGGAPHEPLDTPAAHDASARHWADGKVQGPDTFFDRQWALTLMERGLAVVEKEFSTAGRAGQFPVLKPWLAGEGASLSQAQAAKELGMTEGAVKVMIHRLRKRFREAIRAEIAQTLAEGADIDAELRYLIEVLAQT